MKSSVSQEVIGLLQAGPRTASEIYKILGAAGHSSTTCRTAVNRLVTSGKVFRAKYRLHHNDSILSTSPQFRSAELLKELYASEFGGRPAVLALCECLRTSHPVVSKTDVAKLASLRIGLAQKPDWHSTVELIHSLIELGIIYESGDYSHTETFWYVNEQLFRDSGLGPTGPGPKIKYYILRERIRAKLAEAAADWLWQNSFASKGGTQSVKSDPETAIVTYANVPYDCLGFSYTHGIASHAKGGKPTPRAIAGDVLLDACNVHYARSFIERIKISSRAASPSIGFILAAGFEHDAFVELKQSNLLPWATDQLLGKSTASAIQSILSVTQQIVNEQNVNPSILMAALDGMNNFGSFFGNLKGTLFEIVVAYLFQLRGYHTRFAWQISSSDSKDTFDVDIVAINNSGDACIVECKAMAGHLFVDPTEVKKHFHRRTPCARRKILDAHQPYKISRYKSIVVSTGKFDDDAGNILKQAQSSASGDLECALWDRVALIKELDDLNQSELKQIIERYF